LLSTWKSNDQKLKYDSLETHVDILPYPENKIDKKTLEAFIDLERAWNSLSFSGIRRSIDKEGIDIWITVYSPQSKELIDKIKVYMEELHPVGRCVFQRRDIIPTTQGSSPCRFYRISFFDSIDGMTAQALEDKLVKRVKDLKEIVEEYKA